MTASVVAVILSVLVPQDAADRPAPSDTLLDPNVLALLERAREVRGRSSEGILTYEAVMHERTRASVAAFRFRRARTHFDQERIARLRWERDGGRTVEWVGARRLIPTPGATAPVQDSIDTSLSLSLVEEGSPAAMEFNPWTDRIVIGEAWFQHPLAASSEADYRFSLGETTQSVLLLEERAVTTVELVVEPRRVDPHLFGGSLWFDEDSGALVRATYRLPRPVEFGLDASAGGESTIPEVVRPLTGEISGVTVDYDLVDSGHWLPVRILLVGTGRVGEFSRIPLTVEVSVSGYTVNDAASEMAPGDSLPPLWTRLQRRVTRGERNHLVTLIMPPTDSLLVSDALSKPGDASDPNAPSISEMDEVRAQLERLLPRTSSPRFFVRSAFDRGATKGLARFNRVEGVSLGADLQAPLRGQWGILGEARLGTADVELNGEVSVFHGDAEDRFAVTGYRRLDYASDWRDPFRLSRSIRAIITGGDHGQFFRTLGVEATRNTEARFLQHSLRLFVEEHSPAEKETDFFLGDVVVDRTIDDLIAAEEGTVAGGEMDLRWQSADGPDEVIVSARSFVEGGVGDFDYWRWGLSSSIVAPLTSGLFGAVQGSLGMASSSVPLQRQFFLGGSDTFRGIDSGDPLLRGTSFWFGRTELAHDIPLARIALFGDFAWTGDGQRVGSEGWVSSVGTGVSLLQGFVRIDVARVVHGPQRWRVDLNFDGLL